MEQLLTQQLHLTEWAAASGGDISIAD